MQRIRAYKNFKVYHQQGLKLRNNRSRLNLNFQQRQADKNVWPRMAALSNLNFNDELRKLGVCDDKKQQAILTFLYELVKIGVECLN